MKFPWIPILCYHRVCPQKEVGTDSKSLCVTPAQFKNQMALLKLFRYQPISLQDLTAFLQSRKNINSRSVVLTFDDGYEDNYLYAFPILKRFSFPATIFLVTDLIGKKNLWDSGTTSLLNETQIEEMSQNGIIFGSHTATHIDLTQKSSGEVREELQRSRIKLEELTSRFDIPFCYPYARVNETSKNLAQESGYFCALAGDRGAQIQKQNYFELTRIQIFPSDSTFRFWKKIQPWYPQWLRFQQKLKNSKVS